MAQAHSAVRGLDVGCGSGEPIAAYLIGCGNQVTGIDFRPMGSRSWVDDQECGGHTFGLPKFSPDAFEP
jgi:SAM-dependent methyltransferase